MTPLTIMFLYGSFKNMVLIGVASNSLNHSDRSQKCSINGHLSNIAPVSCGVPLGSNRGSLLFRLVYINDLPNLLNLAYPRMLADDTNISFAASTTADLGNVINLELRNLNC